MNAKYKKFACTSWPFYRFGDKRQNIYIGIDETGKIRIEQLLPGYGIVLERGTARLLARRINQALEESKQ